MGLSFWTTQAGTTVAGRQAVLSSFATSPAARELSGALYREAFWLVADQLGTPRMAVDKSGSLTGVRRHDYLPFGEELYGGMGGRPTAQGYGAADNVRQEFTKYEHDGETGLDYAQARYFASAQGRFTSTDPLLNSGRPWEPQSWNRYSYVRNNPIADTDPTGLYDLNNTCVSGDKKCNKNFEKYADALKKGLANLEKNLAKVKDPVRKARLEAALHALGAEGDHNGVKVTFGEVEGSAAGKTDPSYNTQTGKLEFNVTLDPNKIKDSDSYAKDAAHEGTHLADISDPRYADPATTLSPFSFEYRAYETSAWAWSALGKISLAYKGKGGDTNTYEIWNSSWGKVDDKALKNFITSFRNQKGRQTHPETTPHNPWPN